MRFALSAEQRVFVQSLTDLLSDVDVGPRRGAGPRASTSRV